MLFITEAMAKNNLYFSHDTNARQDPKLQEVMMEHGLAGVGAYWCIIEQLYEQDGRLPRKNYRTIAFALHCEVELIRSVVEDFELFCGDDDCFWSDAVCRRLNERKGVSDKRREAISKRWDKTPAEAEQPQQKDAPDTNVIQMNYKSNTTESGDDTSVIQTDTLKSKVKENKRKENNNNSLSVSLSLPSDTAESRASVTLAERQSFLEIFFFERNLKDPTAEVERFCAHYDANGWCRKDSKTPVKDKTALAKLWRPQTEGARFNDTALKWLSEVYAKVKANEPQQAWRILTEIYGLGYEVQDSRILVRIYCTTEARQTIERQYVFRRGWQVQFQIKQQ